MSIHLDTILALDRQTVRRTEFNLLENEKSAQTQKLRAGVVRRSQKFSPRRRPVPGARDGQNLITWRWS